MLLLSADDRIQGNPVVKGRQRALVCHSQREQVQVGDLAVPRSTPFSTKGQVAILRWGF